MSFNNGHLGKALLFGDSLSHMFNDAIPLIQIALIPVFMKEFNLTVFQVGLITSIPLVCGTLSILFAGFLADRIHHINQVVIAFSLMGISSIMVALARDVIFLTVFLSLIVVSNSIFHPAGFSLGSKIMKPERRTTALGFFNAGGIMGFAVGPFSVGVLLGYLEWRAVYLFWTALLSLIIVYMLVLKSKGAWRPKVAQVEESSKPSIKSVLALPLIILLAVVGIEWMGRHMIITYLTSFLVFERSFTIQTASVFLGLISIAGIIGGPLGGFIADRIGVLKWFMICIGSLMTFTYLILISPNMWSLAMVAIIFGFFAAGEMASGSSLISKYVHINRRGLGYSLYFLSINAVSAVAPLIGALIAEGYSFSHVFYGAILLMVLALAIIWLGLRRRDGNNS
ncbi:MAG: MFS transporter [Candidatus Hodarchaeota archaeon]